MRCPPAHILADLSAHSLGAAAERKLEAHVAGCVTCRAALARVQLVQQTMSAVAAAAGAPGPAVAPGTARLEATLRWMRIDAAEEKPRVHWYASRRVAVAFGAAAAVTMAAGVAVLARYHNRAAPAAVIVKAIPVAPAVPVAAPPPAPVVVESLPAVPTLVSGDARGAAGLNAFEPVNPAQALREGARLQTSPGARLAFQWGEGSGAELDGGSELSLARLGPKAQELRLARGRVAVRVGPHQPGESLRVFSPDHSVTVHGTWFIVAVEPRGTSVQVLEGVVEVAALSGDGASTRLVAPSRAVFSRGSGVTENERPLTGREATALRLATEMGLLGWSAADLVLGSTGLLSIASDPPAQLVVDGVAFGATPLALRRPRGRHLVELTRPGYTTMRQWITVGEEPNELRVALPREKVVTTPPAPEEVRQVMTARRRQVSACYERSLKRDPSLQGTVTLELRIGPAGQVLGTRVEANTLHDEPAVTCLRNEAAGWAFLGARNATIVYPFVFRAP